MPWRSRSGHGACLVSSVGVHLCGWESKKGQYAIRTNSPLCVNTELTLCFAAALSGAQLLRPRCSSFCRWCTGATQNNFTNFHLLKNAACSVTWLQHWKPFRHNVNSTSELHWSWATPISWREIEVIPPPCEKHLFESRVFWTCDKGRRQHRLAFKSFTFFQNNNHGPPTFSLQKAQKGLCASSQWAPSQAIASSCNRRGSKGGVCRCFWLRYPYYWSR